jgi:outer membrane receptor protein involved in Fe transport
MGFEHFVFQADSFFDAQVRPLFNFANWTAFATGQPATYSQNFGNSVRSHRQNMQFAFFQDDWKVSRRLTVNLGMRVETVGGITETNGLLSNLNMDCRDSIGAAGSGPLGCLQQVPRTFNRNTNWGPRVGFAYDLGGVGKTVIRAGTGLPTTSTFSIPSPTKVPGALHRERRNFRLGQLLR